MSSVSNRASLSLPPLSSTQPRAKPGVEARLPLISCAPTRATALASAPVLSLRTPLPRFPGALRLPPPSWRAQPERLVPNPFKPPTPDLDGVTPRLAQPHGPLTVRGRTYYPITLDQLRPGDIAFDYRAVGRSWRQNVISLGERVQNLVRPDRAGSSNILHAFIVLQTYPQLGKVRVADAATGAPPYGVLLTDLNLGEFHTKDAFHLFYRLKDPRMQTRIAIIARNWAAEFLPNFSAKNAFNSLVQNRDLDSQTQARLLRLSQSSTVEEPMRNPDATPYQVMCSEFVTNVGAAAAMALYAEDHDGVRLGDPETLRGIAQGPGGSVFNANPASMTPSALAQRLATDPQAEIVGYVYSVG